ncbi:hypothetical protein CPT_Silence52 [Bacillus phage Silence]|nr:hypothetical protein CPT_Silence52 [Bacillus phage Silence]
MIKDKAPFRKVKVTFWDDEQISEDLTPEDRYFYLYLMTNPFTTQLGIYTITRKQIANHLGYNMEVAENLLKRFEEYHNLIKYNRDTKEMALLKWPKHNWNVAGTPVGDLVTKELNYVKDKTLIPLLLENAQKSWLSTHIHAYLNAQNAENAQEIIEDDAQNAGKNAQKSQNAQENAQNNAQCASDAQAENDGKRDNTGLDSTINDAHDDTYHKKGEVRNKKKELKDMRNSSELLENEFNEFWDLYNKKLDRKRAFNAFKTQRKAYSLETILEGAKKYLSFCQANGTQKQYIKHPTTFLNGECFKDDYESVGQSNGKSVGTSIRRDIESELDFDE